MDAQSGALIVHRALRTRTDRGSVFRTNLHRFHASFGFGPGFEHAVVDYRRRGVFQRCVLPLVPDIYRLLDGKELRHAPESSTAGCSNGGGPWQRRVRA
jgi:hypothetical protein